MNPNFSISKITGFLFLSIILIYSVLKAYSTGNDINVYLFASRQLFNQENIFAANPFNNYLYSPLFAFLLAPISIFDYPVARMLWAVINVALAVRLWDITSSLIKNSMGIDHKLNIGWTIGVIIISLGFLNHNLILGQITILILWLTFEGLYQVIYKNRSAIGALLLALGITVKIIPFLGLYYLLFKGKYRAVIFCTGFIIAGLLLPSFIIGHEYNFKMLQNWTEIVTPTNDNYVFEYNTGTQSLNGILPAYFYDFKEDINAPVNLKRQILALPRDTLVIIMQIMRVLLLLSTLILVFYRYKERKENEPIYFYWEFSYLALVSALIFPHQQKYAMLYFVPAGSYMILFVLLIFKLKWEVSLKHKIIAVLASLQMFAIAIMGRDLVGNYLVNIFDYYHMFGLINLVFLIFLILVKPDMLIDMYRKTAADTSTYSTVSMQNL